jgi:hypothetical protein
MKSLLPAGVLLLAVVGIITYALTALTAEANFRTGTASKTPLEAIEKSVSMIRTDRRLPDEIGRRLDVTGPWKPGEDPVAGELPE